MALNDDNDENIEKRHREICLELNMDTSAATASWESYNSIRENCTLEGNPMHWLCCSLYVACRKDMTPTVGTSEALVEGNCVNLTRLLRLCNISLGEFFKKVRTWVEMTNMPESFTRRIDRLEKSIAVSVILFQKFQVMFEQLFVKPIKETSRVNKSRKQNRNIRCSSAKLSQFCWVLFVCTKGENPHKSDDLVCLYHLLLCCIDLMYSNAIMAGRTDLINSNFKGLPANWNTANWTTPTKPVSVLNILCSTGDCAPTLEDAMITMEYTLKPILKRYFKESVLLGDSNNLTKIIDVDNFEKNHTKLNNLYDTYVLSVGEFDERILFDDYGNASGSQDRNGTPIDRAMSMSLTPHTPLTNQRYLSGRSREHGLSPFTKATQTLARLQDVLEPYKDGPTAQLQEMFTCLEENPLPKLQERVENFSKSFVYNYTASLMSVNRANARAPVTPNQTVDNSNISQKRLQLSVALYWRLLENILKDEQRRKRAMDMRILLDRDIFHQTLFACCVEIIIFTYGSQQHKFPWVLDCYKLNAFDFYKIIEIVVRTEEKLTRDIVKHLNNIEEQILGSKAWESNSVLWERLTCTPGKIPLCQDVVLPELIATEDVIGTPISNPTVRRLASTPGAPNSPISCASERFQSPIGEQARKQLFRDPSSVMKAPSFGQNLPQAQNQSPSQPRENSDLSSASPSNSGSSKKGGSLSLFFRKFYKLASVRMERLCKELMLHDMELQRKIWTCFEYAIIQYTELMKDRHLDQILMCSVYVMCKVCGSQEQERSFTEIMRNYRLQPQSSSHVYRSVLISKRPAVQNPNDPAGTPLRPDAEERGDLIRFYNQVYVVTVQEFALRFSRNNQNVPTLSPLPVGRSPCLSPRRVSDQHALFVTTLDSRQPPKSGNCHVYEFSRSPAKSLREINAAMNSTTISNISLKRRSEHLKEEIVDDEDMELSTPRIQVLTSDGSSSGLFVSSKKLRGLINDRQVDRK